MRNARQAVLLFFFAIFCWQLSAQSVPVTLAISEGYYNKGRYDSALVYAWMAEPRVADSTTRNSKEYAYFTGQYFSMNHEAAGNFDSAGYWYLFSLNMFEANRDTTSNEYGETLINYGNMLNHQAYYTKARPYLQKGKAVMEKHRENVNAYLACLNNLANNYNYSGAYFLARDLYRQCMAGLKRHPEMADAFATGILFQNLGTLNRKTGNTKEAERYLQRAAVTSKKVDRRTYYEAMSNLGYLYLSLGQVWRGEKIFEQLCADTLLQQHTGSSPDDLLAGRYVQALNGRGLSMEMQGYHSKAAHQYQLALSIAEKLTDPRGVLTALGNLAHLYSNTHRRQAADSIYKKLFAKPLQQTAFDHFAYLNVYTQYCENLVLLPRLSEALEQVKRLSEMLFIDLQNNFAGMAEDEQMSFLISLNHYKNLLPFMASQASIGHEAIHYSLNRLLQLKGMILSNQQQRLQALRTSPGKEMVTLNQQWLSLKEQLYNSYSTGKNKLETDSLELLATQKGEEIALKTGIPLDGFNDSLTTTLHRQLRPGEAVVEYIRYRQVQTGSFWYGAYILQPQKPPVFAQLCGEEVLRACFKTTFSTHFNTLHQLNNSQRLRSLIWNPVWKQLRGAATVYYNPDGLINYLSLEALPSADGHHQYVLQDVNLVQLSGIRSLLNNSIEKDRVANAAVLWGNIDCSEKAYLKPTIARATTLRTSAFNQTLSEDIKGPLKEGFKPLEQDELPTVKKILKDKKLPIAVYEKRSATEENFKKDAGSFAGWLHISSHGFYATSPADTNAKQQYANHLATQMNPLLRCGLVLNGGNRAWKGKAPLPNREDGILTGYEIAMMDLSKVRLVVLSACETGLGDIDAGSEGVLGLQRAFRLAGVGKMVMSLWNVKAGATEQLMNLFYKELLRSNNPAAALRTAKLQMLQKENLPDNWAGFVLVQ